MSRTWPLLEGRGGCSYSSVAVPSLSAGTGAESRRPFALKCATLRAPRPVSPQTAVPSVISNVASFYSAVEVKNLASFLTSSFTSNLKFSPLPNSVTHPKMSHSCVIFPPLHCPGRGCSAGLLLYLAPFQSLCDTAAREVFIQCRSGPVPPLLKNPFGDSLGHH